MSAPRPDNDASGAVSCAVLTLGMAFTVGAVAALCVPTVAADDPWTDTTPEAYSAQDHSVAPADEGCYVYDVTLPCVPMPIEMAERAVFVWTGCEVKGIALNGPADGAEHGAALAAATGALGERGQAQLHPVHRESMQRAGLDYEDEGARIRWSVRLWEGRGWYPTWSCGR